LVDIGVLGPLKGNSSSGFAINDFGLVIGSYSFPTASPAGSANQPFLYWNGKV
jgi:hypothetical protein